MSLQSVAVIDDSEDIRETTSDKLRDQFDPKPLDGPFESLTDLVREIKRVASAAVCDHQLTTRGFAPCSGAEVVAELYKQQFPAVLVTRWKISDAEVIRPLRPFVSVVLDPAHFDETTFQDALRVCEGEFQLRFRPSRRPWKTIVSIEDVEEAYGKTVVKALVPSWRSQEGIRFPIDIIPMHLRPNVKAGAFLYASVNTGAESQEDLYLRDFECR